ncbi:peptide/nickel transport system permease protein [Pseudochelatococcus lubricantis]|uniref:Peptide/nickel transport system permease protein n=1 Tax=Pseudochelatococcus lubricantis TaxID=1538102 RepID=A0ABX0UYX0_9HYPH|nr:peptide/nickel transport system permease protein [Pseudochelatococcus lubricantis]
MDTLPLQHDGRPGPHLGRRLAALARFCLLKLARTLATLWIVVTFTFVILRLTGDPALSLLPDNAPPDIAAAFRSRWGLDRPVWTQYALYFRNMLDGNLGYSLANGRDAVAVVLERVPATLRLTVSAFALTLAVGLPVGVFAALRHGRMADRALMMLATVKYSLPNFVIGIGLIYAFAIWLRLLPSSGSATAAHLILPVVTLGLSGAAVIARFTRSAALETLGQPYVRAAMAAGETRTQAIVRHVLPNAAVPILTVIGFTIGGLVGGSIIVEQVFAWPGIGRLLVDAVAVRDLAVAQVIVILLAVAMVTANLAIDLAYGLVNPRFWNNDDDIR